MRAASLRGFIVSSRPSSGKINLATFKIFVKINDQCEGSPWVSARATIRLFAVRVRRLGVSRMPANKLERIGVSRRINLLMRLNRPNRRPPYRGYLFQYFRRHPPRNDCPAVPRVDERKIGFPACVRRLRIMSQLLTCLLGDEVQANSDWLPNQIAR